MTRVIARVQPGPAHQRYRMRRLTDEELAELCRVARQGANGPGKALGQLWDLILLEAHGVDRAQAAAQGRAFHVQDYAIAEDQAQALYDAMMKRRRLHRSKLASIGFMWLDQSPAEY